MKKSITASLMLATLSVPLSPIANAQIFGDVNNDGKVDVGDAVALSNAVTNNDTPFAFIADIDNNGAITQKDVTKFPNFLINGAKGQISDGTGTLTGNYLYGVDGLYRGLVPATSWGNWKFVDPEGNWWGNSSTKGTFYVDKDNNPWYMWYMAPAGLYFTKISTKNGSWNTTYLAQAIVSSDDLNVGLLYDMASNTWKGRINIPTTGTYTVTLTLKGKLYNATNYADGASTDGTDKSFSQKFDLVVSEAGANEVTFDVATMSLTAAKLADYEEQKSTTGSFAKGADVGWLTQLEAAGQKFYNQDGEQKELITLLRDDCGVNSIRLRVWVNPTNGWNNIDDVAYKASRAAALGMRIMIDFHYSDTWADPSKQATPAAWSTTDLEELKTQMADHTKEVLNRLKSLGVTPEWVQVGNETHSSILLPLGDIVSYPANFAALINSGCEAVKSVFPEAKVIVHCDKGDEMWLYTRICKCLQDNGANYDMVGMSFYPENSTYETKLTNLKANINTIYSTYGKETMVCEIGTDKDDSGLGYTVISDLIKNGGDHLKGVFYWEPETPTTTVNEVNYGKGCFDASGKPTAVLDAFKEN